MKEIKDIVVFGTGAIGSVIATFLQCSNLDQKRTIHLVGRPKLMNLVKTEGLFYLPFGKTAIPEAIHTTGYRVHTDIAQVPRADVIFISMKAHGLKEGFESLQPLLQRDNPYVFLAMNGLGLKDIAKHYIGVERIIECVMNYPSILVGNQVKNDGGNANIVVKKTPTTEWLIPALFQPNTLDVRQIDEFKLPQWKKALMNIGMNAISAIPMLKVGEVLDRPSLGKIIIQLIKETVEIAEKEGVSYDEDMQKFFWQFAGRDPDHYTSTYFDIIQNKLTEVEYMNGYIVKKGKEYNIPTPANDAIYNLAKIVEGRI